MSVFQCIFILFIVSLLFGCIIGAYYGTIEYRIRHDLPLITLSCSCPACHHTLPGWQQIPILGWLLLKGRCHFCSQPIPIRYPLIECGFIIYYGCTFLFFRHHPAIFLLLWYLFICFILISRAKRHYRSLAKGILIMSLYHFVISLLYICLYAALEL